MLEPSPTPWHLFDNGTEIWAQGPPDAPVIVVADTQLTDGPISERAKADAQRIVDAVNAYDELCEIAHAARAWTVAVAAWEPMAGSGQYPMVAQRAAGAEMDRCEAVLRQVTDAFFAGAAGERRDAG